MFALSTATHLSRSLADHFDPTVGLRQSACLRINNSFRQFLVWIGFVFSRISVNTVFVAFATTRRPFLPLFPICMMTQFLLCARTTRRFWPQLFLIFVFAYYLSALFAQYVRQPHGLSGQNLSC